MQSELKELIYAASQISGLSETVIEKDYHVTRAIELLSQLENQYFNLIFSGGTCLAKAHKAIHRMSEDIDFKLHLTDEGRELSRTRKNKEARILRNDVLSILTDKGFISNKPIIRNEGRYVQIKIGYPLLFPQSKVLRSDLQIELNSSEVLLPTLNLSLNTLIEDILNNNVQLISCNILCISIIETSAEKWVALTRKISAIERGYVKNDPTLIRHLHDLSNINKAINLSDSFYALVKNIIQQDAIQFKSQHPEYNDDPILEVKRSISILENDLNWLMWYDDFINAMVFDTSEIIKFSHAVQELKLISNAIILSYI